MSIAPARRVSSSSAGTKPEHSYAAGSRNEQFVEIIDTNNNISVRDREPDADNPRRNFPFAQKENEQPVAVSPSVPYVSNSLEALAVSGIFETEDKPHPPHRVNIYDSNQSIITDEEIDRTGHNYLKHFYEKNEHLEEVDEFI